MDISTYAIEHAVEQTHWWFVGRRFLFQRVIQQLKLSKNAAIMDVGSSTGTNLRLLKDMAYTNYHGLDISTEAQKFCEEKSLGKVHIGDVQHDHIKENYYDLILATDVLEHLEEDHKALKNLCNSIKPSGYLLITVPCFPCLWGPQDIVANHLRRYTKHQINLMLKQNHMRIEKSFYFNFLLFVPIWFTRKILLKARKITNENQLNSPLINILLKYIFYLDCWLASYLNPPFGVSALILARK